MERTRTLMALAALLANAAGCVGTPYDDDGTPRTSNEVAARLDKPEFVAVADTARGVDTIVREAATAAVAQSRRVVVYVGAPWCEPCQRFHDAVERGELDQQLAGVRFLEFDADKHTPMLDAAGYGGQLIPRFVVPGDDGRGTDAKIEGGTKGEGAVAHIMGRLARLLAA